MNCSANDLLDKDCPPPVPQPNQPQRPTLPQVDRLVAASPPAVQHHRSRSDLTDSILVQNKWLKYEEIKQKERRNREGVNAPLAVPESSMTLATLNLEDAWARGGGGDPMMRVSAGPVVFAPQVGVLVNCNFDNNDCISRAPFCVKHAQLH